MNAIKVLHDHCIEHSHDSLKVRSSWKKVDAEVKQYLPAEKQDDFLCLLNEHCHHVEYQAFLDGFRMATKIWKKYRGGRTV